jgi:SAM-dependent methyltransferase
MTGTTQTRPDADRARHYDAKYRDANYFGYRRRLYAPYVSTLIRACGLPAGASVLDVGCGQGFFSYLFRTRGMRVTGVDVSETGIRTAERLYGPHGITFTVADVRTARFPARFDCVFVRSCSLHNTGTFPADDATTRALLGHVKPGGAFIFAYNSNFSSKPSPTWRYHSLADVRAHFSRYPDARVFFSTRVDTWLLGRFALTPLVTRVNVIASRLSGIGGDLVCILRAPSGETS